MQSCSSFLIFVKVAFLVSVTAFAPLSLRSDKTSRPYYDHTVLDATKRKGATNRKKGFGEATSTSKNPTEKSIYSLPALYDLAFGYRNYEEEVKFLLYAHEMCTTATTTTAAAASAPPQSVLELAAGPARHSLTALTLEDTSVKSVTAVDLSPEMVQYATRLADELLGSDNYQRDAFTYILGDMRTWKTDKKFDTAWILLGSLQHMQTNVDVISCLQSARNCLIPGGTLILELPHPRETFSMVECTKNGWEVPLEDEDGNECGELKIVWGDETDVFDPIQQVRQFTVSFELLGTNKLSEDLQSVKQVVPMRLFTAQEIDALARCSGFEVAAMYGALSKEVDVNDDDEAFRLVCVLRKTQYERL
jgi:SAM-dependent methyltransferase